MRMQPSVNQANDKTRSLGAEHNADTKGASSVEKLHRVYKGHHLLQNGHCLTDQPGEAGKC